MPDASSRPVYTIRLRPEPGVDGIRAVRALLKSALRRHGLRCVEVEEVCCDDTEPAVNS